MSYTKQTFQGIIDSVSNIQKNTIEDNDLTGILEYLNSLMEIGENISKEDKELEFYWNEIVSDAISSVFSAISGQYRIAITGLRNVLELSCHAYFYHDHKIELSLFINENNKADKYVSNLVKNFDFFTSPYIKTFYPDIINIQTRDNSISDYLISLYSKLCDVVHGRFKTLTKKDSISIEYNKNLFKAFESNFKDVINIITCMYILRFNSSPNKALIKLANKSNTLKFK